MAQIITFGTSGYCENCSPEHDHPLNNLIGVEEMPDIETPNDSVQQIAEALADLPAETLTAIKQALGI